MTQPDLLDEAHAAAADCVVFVNGQDGEIGSGTWVAPSYVLTCAHVANGWNTERVTVTWRGQEFQAEIAESQPLEHAGGGLWPYPDLALLRVLDAPDHPCILMRERHFSMGLAVVAIGYASTYQLGHEGSQNFTFFSGQVAGFVGSRPDVLWQFRNNEIALGMSGGPVLDQATGALVGVVKLTREEDTDQGGLLVPLRGLRRLTRDCWQRLWRAHDSFHATDVSPWPYLVGELSRRTATVEAPITAREQADLYGLLTQVPEPSDLIATFTGAMPVHATTDDEPLGLRDIAARLADRSGGGRPVHPLLEWVGDMAQSIASTRIRADLSRWNRDVARRRGELGSLKHRSAQVRRNTTAQQPPSIMIQIEPAAMSDEHFGVTAWLYRSRGNVDQYHCDEEPNRTFDEAVACACDQIRTALRWLRGNAQIEFFTTLELANAPLDELSLRAISTLGMTNQVVVRSLERLQSPEIWHEWRKRWTNLRDEETKIAVEWVDCADQTSIQVRYANLLADPETAVVGLARRPQDEHTFHTAAAALEAGVPVIVWRRDACGEHDNATPDGECTGSRFRNAVADLVTRQRHTLPEAVRLMRLRGVQERADPSRGIVLLWDDPDRVPFEPTPLDQPGLLAPTEESTR